MNNELKVWLDIHENKTNDQKIYKNSQYIEPSGNANGNYHEIIPHPS
jgi:hypothetical protein